VRELNPEARIVLHCHDEILASLPSDRVAPWLEAIDAFLCVSDFITNRLRHAHPGISGRCVTLHNGVDRGRFNRVAKCWPRDREKTLIYVGRLSPEKGLHVLLKAFNQVVRSVPDCRLKLIGKPGLLAYSYHLGLTDDVPSLTLRGYYGTSLIDRIDRQILRKGGAYLKSLRRSIALASASRISMLAEIPNAHLPDHYAASYLSVVPSVWEEPFGLPVTEAMACGLPVVASLGGALPELVEDGKTGRLVNRADPQALAEVLVELLRDVKFRDRLAENAYRRVHSSLGYERSAQKLDRLYASVCQ
jgi:glycosyltransferase involved in cell wall biosynthesis